MWFEGAACAPTPVNNRLYVSIQAILCIAKDTNVFLAHTHGDRERKN